MVFTLFTILSISINWELRYTGKRGGSRKRVCWNRRPRHFCTLALRFLLFLLFFSDKKLHLILLFYLLVNVFRGGGGGEFWKLFFQRGGKWPWGRKGCLGRGVEVGGTIQIKYEYEMNFVVFLKRLLFHSYFSVIFLEW